MPGANEADGTNGIGVEMLAQAPIQGKKGRLHRFHEEAVVKTRGSKDLFKLGEVERRGLLAHYVLAGGKQLYADFRVGVGMSGNVDGIDVGRGELVEGIADSGYGEAICVRMCALGCAAPDGGESGRRDSLQSLSKAGGGAAWTGYAPANELQMVVYFGAFHLAANVTNLRGWC